MRIRNRVTTANKKTCQAAKHQVCRISQTAIRSRRLISAVSTRPCLRT